jgi:DNA invertase Pin-like site-specific DNA recombinase
MTTAAKLVRCAIYTRKSTEHNLDLEFNSLHAQREACEAYIKSQLHEGWRLHPARYDDGAFSDGTLDRPDLQRLLADIRAKKIDNVVVYKVDRLTRSLTDFAKLVELFDANGVSFVSVTQAFNTTNSMGRLTLNVLLSFAQFEREVIAERVRDKVAASKRKGMWMGGGLPLGYINRDKKLIIVPEEADTVRWIFRSYLEAGSIGRLLQRMEEKGIRSKRRDLARSKIAGGLKFRTGSLRYLLRNRSYVGEILHRGQTHVGDHEAIIDRNMFETVQVKLSDGPCSAGLGRYANSALNPGNIGIIRSRFARF